MSHADAISSNKARELLYDWHSGQTSPEYAAASSGLVLHMRSLIASIEATLAESTIPNFADEDDHADLRALIDYLQGQDDEAPRRTVGGVTYLALPWAKEYL